MNLDKHHIADAFPATPLQQGMLYHALAADDAAMYLEQYGFSVHGELDIERYRKAWQQTLDHQPMLRTTFFWEGLSKAYQIVQKYLVINFEYADLSNLGTPHQKAALDEIRQRYRTCGFDLQRGPLFTVGVVALAKGHHKIWLTLHHLLTDGWSLALLLSEVGRRYQHPAQPIEPSVPFRLYCEWLAAQDLPLARQWWLNRLSNSNYAGTAPLAARHYGNASLAFDLVLSREDSDRWRQGCSRQGLTENSVFCAAWAILLSRYLHQDRVVFGYTVSTRPADICGIDRMLGLLLNVLPVNVNLDWMQPTADWLQDLQRQLLADRKFDYLPLNEIQHLAGTASERAMFESLLVWENQPGGADDEAHTECLQIVHDESYERNHYPLMLAGYPGSKVRLRLTGSVGGLSEKRAQSMLSEMLAAMLALAEASSRTLQELPIGAAVIALPEVPSVAPTFVESTGIWERICELAQQSPDTLQLREFHTGICLSRIDLVRRSRHLARQLADTLPTDRTRPIALLLWPGAAYVCAILAALQLGRPWLALDPRKPCEGLALQLKQAQPSVLVTDHGLWPNTDLWNGSTVFGTCLSDTISELEPIPEVLSQDDDCACMVLTSGSTGQPKCVRLPYSALRHRLAWMDATYPASRDDCMILKTSPAFVDAICEVLGPLLAGYLMIAPEPAVDLDLEQLYRLLADHSATRLVITPSVLYGLIHVMAQPLPTLRLIQISGERLSSSLLVLAQRWFPNARILNVYGSSEVMADVCVFDCTEYVRAISATSPNVPLGRLLPGTLATILDAQGRPAPEGAIGELYLGGRCLAIDYHLDAATTAARFKMLDCLEGRPRMYATGDLVSLDESGYLHYHGRSDHQIKFNGIRIEPAEIESLIKTFNQIDDAAVACHLNTSDNPVLTAHIVTPVSSEDHANLVRELKDHLARHMTRGLVPSHWQFMHALPRNASGKLDRSALRLHATPLQDAPPPATAPQSAEQLILGRLWKDLLKRDTVDIDDDFFAAGGNSISMTQLCFAIRKEFNIPYPIRASFRAPTIREQADLIRQYQRGDQPIVETNPGSRSNHDLDLDAASADTVMPLAGDFSGWSDRTVHIFLSGTQGFINAWLLARLLDEPNVQVSCLAPGNDAYRVTEAIASHLRQFGLWTKTRASRLRAVPGDLGLARFGLDKDSWNSLACRADVLLHTGVEINFVAPYERLRTSNAMSTATMLELATTGYQKPLHFVGSLGVIDHSQATSRSAVILENDPMKNWSGLPNGYLQARWVSDTMMRRAIQRGLPCSVIRMTTVSGDTSHHRANPQDMMWQLFKLAMTVGIIPDSPRPIDLIPVDSAVEAVIKLIKSPQTLGHAWHISNPRIWQWREVAGLLRSHGYAAQVLSGHEWSRQFGCVTSELGQSAEWQKVLPLLGDSWLEYPHFFALNKKKTLEELKRLGVILPEMDESLLWRTVERFIDEGVLPPKTVKQPLTSY